MLVCVLDRENTRIDRIFLTPPQGRVSWCVKREHDPWFRKQILIHNVEQFCSELPKLAEEYTLPGGVFVPKAVHQPS